MISLQHITETTKCAYSSGRVLMRHRSWIINEHQLSFQSTLSLWIYRLRRSVLYNGLWSSFYCPKISHHLTVLLWLFNALNGYYLSTIFSNKSFLLKRDYFRVLVTLVRPVLRGLKLSAMGYFFAILYLSHFDLRAKFYWDRPRGTPPSVALNARG